MNFKYLILNFMVFGSVLIYADEFEYKANQMTHDEMQQLQSIDKNIYELSIKKHDYFISKIAKFIYDNLSYDVEYSHLKILASTGLKVSSIKDDVNIGISLEYPIFDQKEKNEIQKQIVSIKSQIAKDLNTYFQSKAKLVDLGVESLILEQIQMRVKARKLNGMASFDEWMEVVQKIRQNNYDISIQKLKVQESKEILISLVTRSKIKQLKKMIR